MKRIQHIRLFLSLLIITVLLLPLIAAAQMEDFGSLEEVVVWIISGGGSMVLAGYVIAYLLENVPAWHDLPRWIKVLVPIALAGLFGFVAQSVLALELMTGVPPIVKSVLLMAINWLFSQRAYAGIKEGSYGESAR